MVLPLGIFGLVLLLFLGGMVPVIGMVAVGGMGIVAVVLFILITVALPVAAAASCLVILVASYFSLISFNSLLSTFLIPVAYQTIFTASLAPFIIVFAIPYYLYIEVRKNY